MARDVVDAVIVGSGASGSVVAKDLAMAGMRVVVLERGPEIKPEEFALHDELTSHGSGGLRPRVGNEDRFGPREFRHQGDPEYAVLKADEWGYAGNGAVVGGGMVFFGGLMWRRPPIDFRMKTEYGAVAGSTLEDWPLTYDDLEPHFLKIEQDVGVSGEAGANPFEGRRSGPYPLPPIDLNPGDEVIRATVKRMGYHPFPVPLGLLTQNYKGRSKCIGHPCCNGFVCEVGAKSTPLSALLPHAVATGNCQIVSEAIVKEVTLDARGHPTGVSYIRGDGKLHEQKARLVILAAGAIETPRLLLNSTSRRFPQGLGNQSGWVGRNLMGHISPWVWGILDTRTNEGFGPGPGVAIDDFHARNPGFVGGGVIYSRTEVTPIAFAFRRPRGAPRWGLAHKQYQRENFRRYIRLFAPAEDLPQFENRVEVSPALRDAWGIPVARITHSFHPNDYLVFNFFKSKMTEILQEAGARDVTPSSIGRGGAGYQLGTCRMGADPQTSVVNAWGQSHQIDNLFVVDASVFVTSGGRNPALTIQALASRFAAYIVENWRTGAWRGGSKEV